MRITRCAATLAAFGLVLTGCSSEAGDQATEATETSAEVEEVEFEPGSRMAEIVEAGELRVGTKIDQPGFGLANTAGEPEGFDVEIAKLIAAKMGLTEDQITFTETVSANREPFLVEDRVDIVAATYTINDKRKELIDFAGPYTRPDRTSWWPRATPRASRARRTSPAWPSAPSRARRRPRTSGRSTPRRS